MRNFLDQIVLALALLPLALAFGQLGLHLTQTLAKAVALQLLLLPCDLGRLSRLPLAFPTP